jgi:hypothetical protein
MYWSQHLPPQQNNAERPLGGPPATLPRAPPYAVTTSTTRAHRVPRRRARQVEDCRSGSRGDAGSLFYNTGRATFTVGEPIEEQVGNLTDVCADLAA